VGALVVRRGTATVPRLDRIPVIDRLLLQHKPLFGRMWFWPPHDFALPRFLSARIQSTKLNVVTASKFKVRPNKPPPLNGNNFCLGN